MLGLGLGLGLTRRGTILKYLRLFRNYFIGVTADSGTINSETLTKTVYRDLPAQDNIVFAWFGGAGSKKRVSTIYSYFTKLYSMFGTNDATQTTEASQPFVTGDIAPNEVEGMLNPNGEARFVTHPEISFAADEPWSLSFIINNSSYRSSGFVYLNGKTLTGGVKLRNDGRVQFINASADTFSFSSAYLPYSNKNTHLTITYDGLGKLKLYINKNFIQEVSSVIGTLVTNTIFRGRGVGDIFTGSLGAYLIRNIALTPEQITAEYNVLSAKYPEIPSVTIGTQEWATSNFDAVATPQGTVVQEMQAASNVEKVTAEDDRTFASDTGWWIKQGLCTINDGGNGVLELTSDGTAGNQLSKTSLLTVGKYYKVTYTIVANSLVGGSLISQLYQNNLDFQQFAPDGILNSAVGTHTFYAPAQGTSFNLRLYPGSSTSGTLQIDNVSVEEVGWSDSQNLYDAIYAQTPGTAAEKEYAALKAAAMWCYYNNDATIGAVYKKLYNWFAVKLLQTDIDLYNTANPTTPWGWRLSLDVDWDTLETEISGDTDKLKEGSANYWDDNTGTNETGFTALPAGWRDDLGAFLEINEVSAFWNSNEPVEDEDKVMGLSIRIIEE